MKKFKEKGFTLIELIAVLVIMAVLALIATPLVMNIIRKARVSADKRSIDAYGRSIELAISGYLLETGKFPISVEQLTIEYSGNEVECETTQINTDSSVYLAGCTVVGRTVEGYTYGKEEAAPIHIAYNVGDEVRYNNVDYYVIDDSDVNETSVTLLKKTPLTVAEVNQYGGVGTANNHVNIYVTSDTSASYYKTAYNQNGYGGMAYYSSETCGYNGINGCKSAYEESEVKYVVDAWKNAKAPVATTARLIEYNEFENLGYDWGSIDSSGNLGWLKSSSTPNWVYDTSYLYLTMSQRNDSSIYVWKVDFDGNISYSNVNFYNGVVRPVIVLPKSAL